MSIIEKFVNKLKEDGKDHIRISRYAETQLGKVCANDFRRNFRVPNLGNFLNPICFANWMVTGNDDARNDLHMRTRMPLEQFQKFVLYSKYFQLLACRDTIVQEYRGLPMLGYSQYSSGVREMDRWKEYGMEIKKMIEHIADPERGPKVPYPWEEEFPGLLKLVNDHVFQITGVDPSAPLPEKKKPAQKKNHQTSTKDEGEHSEDAGLFQTEDSQVDTQVDSVTQDQPVQQQEVVTTEEQQQSV